MYLLDLLAEVLVKGEMIFIDILVIKQRSDKNLNWKLNENFLVKTEIIPNNILLKDRSFIIIEMFVKIEIFVKIDVLDFV